MVNHAFIPAHDASSKRLLKILTWCCVYSLFAIPVNCSVLVIIFREWLYTMSIGNGVTTSLNRKKNIINLFQHMTYPFNVIITHNILVKLVQIELLQLRDQWPSWKERKLAHLHYDHIYVQGMTKSTVQQHLLYLSLYQIMHYPLLIFVSILFIIIYINDKNTFIG